MQSVDLQVLRQVLAWLETGTPVYLCTVVATFGSSPRPVGSLLACTDARDVVGSLSGGCVEDELIDTLTRPIEPSELPRRFEYGLTAEDTERLGLPCGGHLHVLVERIEPSEAHCRGFADIVQRLQQRRCTLRGAELVPGGRLRFEARERFSELRLHEGPEPKLEHVYGPRNRLFLIGAGMVSGELTRMASALGYEITVCDPRQELIDAWPIADVELLCEMPDDAIRRANVDSRTAIIALTHDPRIDDMGLLEALESDAFYVGAMGSSRTSASRRGRLRDLGVAEESLARLHAPVGLDIGSKTPTEIAIAIVAELTQLLRAGPAFPGTRSESTRVSG